MAPTRERALWFVAMNLVALALAAGIFWITLHAEVSTPALAAGLDWLFAHPPVMVAVASSPLAASLLVGLGYARRAARRSAPRGGA